MQCAECGEETDELTRVKEGGKTRKLCEDCRELWAEQREIEAEVLPTSRELGLGQIVYSPLAQGLLTGPTAFRWRSWPVFPLR